MKLPLYCLAVLICIPLAAQAAVYRCVLPDGSATFQDTPCGVGSAGTVVNVPNVQTVSSSDSSDVIVAPSAVVAGAGYAGSPYPYSTPAGVVVRREVVYVHRAPVVRPSVEVAKHVDRSSPSSTSRTTSRQSHASARK